MTGTELRGSKQRAWNKQLKRPLPKWHVYQGPSNDCGPYAAATVANALYNVKAVDATALARDMEAPRAVRGMWLPARIAGWATMPWGVVGMLRQMGLQARWRLFASPERLRRNLDTGRASIVIIGQPLRFRKRKYAGWSHYMALYAWDPEEGWAFVDSAAPRGSAFSYRDDAEFIDLWNRMGRQVIEVWGGVEETYD